MYDVEISKKELGTIIMALGDSEERLRKILSNMRSSYFDLPNNMKFIWRNKKAYDRYTDDVTKVCCRQLDEVCDLQEKLEELQKERDKKGKNYE